MEPLKKRKRGRGERRYKYCSRLLTSTAPTHSGHLALVRIALSRQSRWKTCPHEMIANSFSSGPRLDVKKASKYTKEKQSCFFRWLDDIVEKTVVAVHTVLIMPHRPIYEAEGCSRMDSKARRTSQSREGGRKRGRRMYIDGAELRKRLHTRCSKQRKKLKYARLPTHHMLQFCGMV